jgi:hypothetical protein
MSKRDVASANHWWCGLSLLQRFVRQFDRKRDITQCL